MENVNSNKEYADDGINYTKKTYQFLKRLMDLVSCVPGLMLFGVAYIVLFFFYISGNNKGPILYTQIRIGKNGKLFNIYKFRSMIVDAENVLKSNPELYQKYIDNNYKLEQHEDPRITKLGRFIRKTSIDELPQFINVLLGDMSLVGPRPILEYELAEYGNKKACFLLMKPGIAGVWQANGRSEVGYPERCDLELSYLKKASIFEDFSIIINTVLGVVLKKGAY